jgi:hypothetical protein
MSWDHDHGILETYVLSSLSSDIADGSTESAAKEDKPQKMLAQSAYTYIMLAVTSPADQNLVRALIASATLVSGVSDHIVPPKP